MYTFTYTAAIINSHKYTLSHTLQPSLTATNVHTFTYAAAIINSHKCTLSRTLQPSLTATNTHFHTHTAAIINSYKYTLSVHVVIYTNYTTSRHGQDSLWKSQSEWHRTKTNGKSTSAVWPTLGSMTAKVLSKYHTDTPENIRFLLFSFSVPLFSCWDHTVD